MKLIDTYTDIGFAQWASYLFNGDSSGMEESDIQDCDNWLSYHEHGPLDVEELGFLYEVYKGIGGDAAEYTFPVYEPEPGDK